MQWFKERGIVKLRASTRILSALASSTDSESDQWNGRKLPSAGHPYSLSSLHLLFHIPLPNIAIQLLYSSIPFLDFQLSILLTTWTPNTFHDGQARQTWILHSNAMFHIFHLFTIRDVTTLQHHLRNYHHLLTSYPIIENLCRHTLDLALECLWKHCAVLTLHAFAHTLEICRRCWIILNCVLACKAVQKRLQSCYNRAVSKSFH